MKYIWLKLFGRSTLRPQLTDEDWNRQVHKINESQWQLNGLHYPGDKCSTRQSRDNIPHI